MYRYVESLWGEFMVIGYHKKGIMNFTILWNQVPSWNDMESYGMIWNHME